MDFHFIKFVIQWKVLAYLNQAEYLTDKHTIDKGFEADSFGPGQGFPD